MRYRCSNPNWSQFKGYGGRGIKVCDHWQKFENFIADMGRRPSPKHQIDRKNNDGNYEPGNCRWATPDQQRFNTRRNRVPPMLARVVDRLRERGMTVKELSGLVGVPLGSLYHAQDRRGRERLARNPNNG